MRVYGYIWVSQDFCGFMGIYGCHGYLWEFIGLYGCLWVFMSVYGYLWMFMGISEYL